MTASDILDELGKASFELALESKVEGMIKLGSPSSEVKNYVSAYNRIVRFDENYFDFLSTLENINNTEIENTDAEQIKFISDVHSQTVTGLDKINTQNPKDLNAVFTPLNQFLDKKGFFSAVTVRGTQGQELGIGKTYIDFLVDELQKLKIKYSPKEQQDFSELKEALEIGKQLTKDKKKFQDAAKIAESWIGIDANRVAEELDDASVHFRNESKIYIGFWPQYVWLLGGGILALLIFGLLFYFSLTASEIKLGQAVLKITSVTILIYFVYLFVNIFIQAKTYRDSYIFKSVALKTMTSLVQSFPDPAEKTITMQSAMSVIFTEPATKQTKAIKLKYVDDLIEVAKKKL